MWVISLERVNMNPDCRLSFTEWLLLIEPQLDTGESLYVSCTGIFDVMSAVWNNMSPEMLTQVFKIIQEGYDEA